MTFSRMTLSILTFRITTFSTIALSRMILGIITPRKMNLVAPLIIMYNQHNDTTKNGTNWVTRYSILFSITSLSIRIDYHYAECCIFYC